MSMISETILNVSIEVLIKKLGSEVIQLFARRERIQADLKKWERTLEKIKAVLDDAQEKQTEKRSVKIWLADLQNLAYDIEDILDEFATEASRRKLRLEPAQPTTASKFLKLLPTCCTKLSPGSIKFDSMMESKIKEITTRFQDIATEKDKLDLKENSGGRSKEVRDRQPSTSFVNESKVYGREKEKEEIIKLLLSDDSTTGGGFSVIPIVGMGGLGKTTLAQLVYNDKTVQSHFDFKAWVCVSEDFDATRITKTVLNSIDVRAGDVNDLNLLQEKLKKKLSSKKFLLVLDDIWNQNLNDWERLTLPFEVGSPGSKIIITTRNEGVSSMVATGKVHLLRTLSDDDCLRIFAQYSLQRTDFSSHQYLKEVGEKIVKKCDGLPLAVKTLGGLLRGKYDFHDWEFVLNSKIWDLPEEKSDITQALKVSYHYLPGPLKRCFSYCSLFPKDYEFCETEIVLLWMVEGLLQLDTSEKEMEEELGHNYFKELQSRSFFQQSNVNVSRFVMHDLINDLAQWAAGEIYCRMEDTQMANKQQKYSINVRHLSYNIGELDGIERFKAIGEFEHLRTFLPVRMRYGPEYYLSYRVIDMLLKLRRLRVLSLSGYCIYEIPSSIGDLKHLRHLNLSGTEIKALPDSINTLYNLHTLLLKNCYRLKKLCTDMGNLIKLHHLNNSNVDSLEEMPLGLGKLTCLQTLCYFVVGQNAGSRLRDLKSLKNLRGKLKISSLENVRDIRDATEAELNGKRKLNELFLEWSISNDNSREPEIEANVLEVLRPHQDLKELVIEGYGGTKLPTWIGGSSFKNLTLLTFEGCRTCTSLPSVGKLPMLKHLSVIGMDGVKSVGSEFYGNSGEGPFPSLETLSFKYMQGWEDWIPHQSSHEVEVFPRLEELSLIRCSKLLGRLPECLPSLKRLIIKKCEQLLVSIPSIPTLCKIEIGGCKKVVWSSKIDPSSLNSLISSDMFPQGLFNRELPNLEELQITNVKELAYLWQTAAGLLRDVSLLHRLTIAECPRLLSLVAEEEEDDQQRWLPCRLQYLELSNCQSLVGLPRALLSLNSLREIEISYCDSLEYLPEAWADNINVSPESLVIHGCNSLTYICKVQLPPRLERVKIINCKNLRTSIDGDQISKMEEDGMSSGTGSSMHASLLRQLEIQNCPSLKSLLGKSELPATLEDIDIRDCSNLALLSLGGTLPKALKKLHVVRCSKLESVARELGNNTLIEIIMIGDCQNFRFLPDSLHKARHLQHVHIWWCPNLVSFPKGGLPSTKLRILRTSNCEKLKALPNGIQNLTSLESLAIDHCPNIGALSGDAFPTNFSSLEIDYMIIYKTLFEKGLHRFTSIRDLSIYGGCSDVVSFPPNDIEMALPASLTRLSIVEFPNLERVSSIQNLTSLESLWFYDCSKLQYFAEKGLPASLLRLYIYGCPLMNEKCKKDKGQYWPLIAHLPFVRINGSFVFDPSEED